MKIFLLIVFLVGLLILFESVNAQLPWLHTDGKWIKDDQGNIVFLHGTNFEGYEYGNYSRNPQFFNHTEWDYKKIADMGFNVVRLPIAWQYIEPVEGQYDEGYFTQFVDKDIGFAKKYGLYIILDFHQYGWSPWFLRSGIPSWMVSSYPVTIEGLKQAIKDFWLGKGPNGTEATQTNPSMKDRMIKVWEYLAQRYKDESTIAGYDLFNEPYDLDVPTDYVYDFYEVLIDNISTVDNNHIFIYEGATNSTYSYGRLLNKDNIIFSHHLYLTQSGYSGDITQLEGYLLGKLDYPESNPMKNWNIPIYVGEFGSIGPDGNNFPNGSQFMHDLPLLFNKYNFHWTVWSYSNSNSPWRIVFPNGTERTEWTDGLVIPYLSRSSIPPAYNYFDQKTKSFKVVFDGSGNVESKIYIPYRHYPNSFTVNSNSSSWTKTWDESNRILTVQATLGSAIEITIDPMITSNKILVDYNKFEGISNLSYGAHVPDPLGQAMDFMCTKWDLSTYTCEVRGPNKTLVDRIKPLNISMMRFQLNRWDFYDLPKHNLCSYWNETTHSCENWDWYILDLFIEAIQKIGAEPIITIGGYDNYLGYERYWIPPGMTENYAGTFYPSPEDFGNYSAEIVKHVNIDKGYNVKYWEIWNEPYPCDTYGTYTGLNDKFTYLFNKTQERMHYVDPSIKISTDRMNIKPLADYFVDHANGTGFISFHHYASFCTCMYPCNSTNINNDFYPPNDQLGWYKDETIMDNVNNFYRFQQPDPTKCFYEYSPKEIHDLWKQRRGIDLQDMIGTEINLNTAFENGTDHRQNDIFGATWYAAKAKAHLLNGVTNLNYFTIAGNGAGPMVKYGGFGYGMMNSSYPYNPFAPYWTNYLLSNYIPQGSLIYNSTSTNSSEVDVLAVKTDDSYNLLLINKVNKTVTVNITISGFDVDRATLYLLDGSTYVQRYEPSLDRTIIYKSEISTIPLPKSNIQTITFNGYSVAILQAFSTEKAPSITTNKQNYNPGETVQISGNDFSSDVDASIQINDPIDALKFVDQNLTDLNGDFSSSYIIPSKATSGIYTIYASSPNEFAQVTFNVGTTTTTTTTTSTTSSTTTSTTSTTTTTTSTTSTSSSTSTTTSTTTTTTTTSTSTTTTTIPGNTETRLYLNGTQGNFYYLNNTYANFTVWVNVSGTVYLNTNITGWTIKSGDSPFTQIVLLNATKNDTHYNITDYFPGNITHDPSSQTHYAIVYVTVPTTTTTVQVTTTQGGGGGGGTTTTIKKTTTTIPTTSTKITTTTITKTTTTMITTTTIPSKKQISKPLLALGIGIIIVFILASLLIVVKSVHWKIVTEQKTLILSMIAIVLIIFLISSLPFQQGKE